MDRIIRGRDIRRNDAKQVSDRVTVLVAKVRSFGSLPVAVGVFQSEDILAKIELDKLTSETLARLLSNRLKSEFELDVAPYETLDLLTFLAETIGPYFYNQGVRDAQAVVSDRAESVLEALYAIEKPTIRR